MLILQGGRGHQVTVADDLVRWQSALAHRPDDGTFFRRRRRP
jgi:hypothetical protein